MNYKVSVARLVTGTFSLHDSENRIKKMLVGKQNPFFSCYYQGFLLHL